MQHPESPYRWQTRLSEEGEVQSVGDGILWISGLPSACMEEVLHIEDGSLAQVFLLEPHRLGAVLLKNGGKLSAGLSVKRSSTLLSIGVGDSLIGRVVSPLGDVLDGGPALQCQISKPLESASAPIMARDFVNQPLYTGNRIIDSLLPIGKGQRQLLIGDIGLGKTSLAIDIILRQQGESVLCIYVAIGQTRSNLAGIVEILKQTGAIQYSTLVVAEANELSGCRYIAPFAGCAIAEYWMTQGRDTLIIYDDLSQHANAYRELSLLLHRPPGREAYPGDIFYLHSRLLERATILNKERGGGSMTALPIVTTKQGEISAYIPTNLISITDGQIYLDQRLFASAALPAIDITRSVSRIGGKAQHPVIKTEAGRIRLDYLQFLELEAFTRYGTRLEAGVEAKFKRGRILRWLFMQERFSPLSAKAQLAWLIAYNEGGLDDLNHQEVKAYGAELSRLADQSSLTLLSPRNEWQRQIQAWLADASTK